MRCSYVFIICVMFLSIAIGVHAATSTNVGFIRSNIWYLQEPFFEGDTVRVYSAIFNGETGDLKGSVIFYDNNTSIGSTSFAAIGKGGTQIVWIDWHATRGNHKISATITNATISVAGKNPEPVTLADNQTGILTTFVDQDTDHDGIGNAQEIAQGTDPLSSDTDKDGVPDNKDPFPLTPAIKVATVPTTTPIKTMAKVSVPATSTSSLAKTIHTLGNAIAASTPVIKNIVIGALNAVDSAAENSSKALKPKEGAVANAINRVEKENNYNKTASVFQTPLNYLYKLFLSAVIYILKHKFLLYPLIGLVLYKIFKLAWKKTIKRK